ncbi:hypothetical protein GCM10007898_00360 [Dyella flagellata]|uniref:Uncharacterized protein n=1 Tax=Dyella flagellata TaxID=1867833 RepID=A0ABQ5X4C0_9GAMM|nr:hypothetical protein GCM10007898_00360 [Dyella flagellata]
MALNFNSAASSYNPTPTLPCKQGRELQIARCSTCSLPCLAGEGRGGVAWALALSQISPDNVKHIFRAQQHFIIPEAQDAKATRLQCAGSGRVILKSIQMLAAIDLHHQHGREANKVDDVAGDWILAPEFMDCQIFVPNVLP